MDRGYNSHKPLIKWTNEKIMWVTKPHPRAVWSVKKHLAVSIKQKEQGIMEDTIISLGNPRTIRINPLQSVRMIRFFDKDNNREFSFISNNLTIDSLTIAGIYKQRWDIEMLFRRIKQNFNLQDFLGDNENAIKIQIWCGFIADLLVKIVKDEVDKLRKRKCAFANVAGLIRQHLATYIDLFAFLIYPAKAMIQYIKKAPTSQLQLYQT